MSCKPHLVVIATCSSQLLEEALDVVMLALALASERSWHGLWCPGSFAKQRQLDHKPCQDRSGWRSASREGEGDPNLTAPG